MFNGRFARMMAKSYRRRGLSRTAQRMVDVLTEDGVENATVLEIGGGVGEIQVELLRRGAASATNLELSPAYEDEAKRLLTEAGLTGRAHRRLIDIAETPDAVDPADVVVLHRVVCCYPDYPRLLGAAAAHARRQLVFSHPVRNPLSRAVVGTQNLFLRLRGSRFRVFVHPPEAMLAVLAEHGMEPRALPGGRVWRVAVGIRAA